MPVIVRRYRVGKPIPKVDQLSIPAALVTALKSATVNDIRPQRGGRSVPLKLRMRCLKSAWPGDQKAMANSWSGCNVVTT